MCPSRAFVDRIDALAEAVAERSSRCCQLEANKQDRSSSRKATRHVSENGGPLFLAGGSGFAVCFHSRVCCLIFQGNGTRIEGGEGFEGRRPAGVSPHMLLWTPEKRPASFQSTIDPSIELGLHVGVIMRARHEPLVSRHANLLLGFSVDRIAVPDSRQSHRIETCECPLDSGSFHKEQHPQTLDAF